MKIPTIPRLTPIKMLTSCSPTSQNPCLFSQLLTHPHHCSPPPSQLLPPTSIISIAYISRIIPLQPRQNFFLSKTISKILSMLGIWRPSNRLLFDFTSRSTQPESVCECKYNLITREHNRNVPIYLIWEGVILRKPSKFAKLLSWIQLLSMGTFSGGKEK